MSGEIVRKQFEVSGRVQGVGFRPTLAVLAQDLGLGGSVKNLGDHVDLELVGSDDVITQLFDLLPKRLPPEAKIENLHEIKCEIIPECTSYEFRILESEITEDRALSFPADVVICPECKDEISDPQSRRYLYPFTTCARCGPRFTVIKALPYDRERTTMKVFPKCEACTAEYTNPRDRRFHAETIACPACGPRLHLLDSDGRQLSGDPVHEAKKHLKEGKILALRGIGGFQLVVDPTNSEAISRLRTLKNRPDKPLAVMAKDARVADLYCSISDEERRVLESSAAPIVLLTVKEERPVSLKLEQLCPDTDKLGVMLPSSPLHWLLLESIDSKDLAFDLLVMTSGNRRGEPICISNYEGLLRLKGIADVFLVHDREIALRADDSVVTVQGNRSQVWRRARGYVPHAITIKNKLHRDVLAMGAELKNTIACGSGSRITPSVHIGDLETPEALYMLESLVESFPKHLRIEPQVVAVDLHPDFQSTRIGRSYAAEHGIDIISVQHHHAHAAAAMAEHGLDECLAIVFDGTGLGTDGHIWGGELLSVGLNGFERLGTFAPAPLPGGDAAVRSPVRQLAGRAIELGAVLSPRLIEHYKIKDEEYEIWRNQTQRSLNTPVSHAVGRLFDAFAAGLGIAPAKTTYEGHAAIKLESAAISHGRVEGDPALRFDCREINGMLVAGWHDLYRDLITQTVSNAPGKSAMAFHFALTDAAVHLVEYGLAKAGARPVVATGGVFCNRLLTSMLKDRLAEKGIQLLVHHDVPPNDGGISVGQALIAGMNLAH